MDINYNIWGDPETWESPSNVNFDVGSFAGKLPVFDTQFTDVSEGRFSIKSAVNKNVISKGIPIDDSPCPWRIRGKSYWTDLYKIAFIGTSSSNFEFDYSSPVYDEYTREMGAPVALTVGSSPSMSDSSSEYIPGMLSPSYIWNYPNAAQNNGDDWTPVLDFNYQKICVVPYVTAYDSNQSQSRTISLYEYSQNPSRYRYIQGLQPRFYVGGAGNWTRAKSNVRLRLFGATIAPFEVTDAPYYNNDDGLLSYADGIGSYLLGATTFGDGFTSYSNSIIQTTTADSFAHQIDTGTNRLYYRAIPENWYVTKRAGGEFFITEYDNVNGDFSIDWIKEQFACLGLWFYTGADVTNFDPANPDEFSHVPLFDQYGTTTGEYATGAAASTAPAGTWTNQIQEKNIYNGTNPPFDPTDYDADNKTQFNEMSISTTTQNIYVVNDFYDVMQYFYLENWNVNDATEIVKKFANVSPIDCVQSYILFPFRIVSRTGFIDPAVYKASDLTTENVKFANVTSDAVAWKLPEQSVIIDMGYINVARHFGDFRDFEPYTSLMLYLPFCGFTQLDCSTFMGKKIKIKYIVDWTSGSCTACIMANNLVVQTANGQIGIQIPLTGTQSAQLRQAIDNAQLQYKQSQTSTVATIAALSVGAIATAATGGAAAPVLATIGAGAGVMANAVNANEKLDYNLQHITTPFKTVGGATPANAAKIELRPRLIISRPKMLPNYDAATFAKTNGFACIRTGHLSEFSGFTQCASVNLDGIEATAEEKKAINTLLLKGVIL